MRIPLILTILFCSQCLASEQANITFANDSAREKAKGEQIQRLINQYELDKWWFTQDIIVDETIRGAFSHPTLTVSAAMPNNDLAGLSQLLHEQIHWFEDSKKAQVKNVIEALKEYYPDVPVGHPNGAKSELSTYLHLAVCLMELDALTELLGKEKAEKIVAKNGQYFYKWIYQRVLADQQKIRTVLIQNDLYIH